MLMLQQWPLVTSTPEQGRVCWDKLHCSHLPSLLLVQLHLPYARRMSKPHPQPAPPSTLWTCPWQTCSASSLCPWSSPATCSRTLLRVYFTKSGGHWWAQKFVWTPSSTFFLVKLTKPGSSWSWGCTGLAPLPGLPWTQRGQAPQ